MQRLRSRWTVVALVPAFFLTGFVLVSALAEDADDPAPAIAEPASGEEAAASESSTAATTVAPAESDAATDPPTTTPEAADDGGGSTSAGDGGGEAGGADWPASLPAGTIQVDYGRWNGLFELEAPEIVLEIGLATVTGQLRYLGGADCQLGRVEIRGRFYDGTGEQIGAGAWDSTWVTGEGGEFPHREPLYLEFYGEVGEAAEAAYLRIMNVECL